VSASAQSFRTAPEPGGWRSRVSAVLSLAKVGFQAYLAYPAGVAMVFVSYPIVILMYRAIWAAVYQGNASAAGMNREEMLAYVTVSWILNTYYMTPTGRNLGAAVRDGQVAMDLIKPINLMAVYLGMSVGRTAFRLCFATLPLLMLFGIFGGLRAPGWEMLLPFALTLLCGYLINFSLDYIIGLMAMFFGYNQGVRMGIRNVMNLAGGMVIPITYFPDGLQSVLKQLPTQYMFFQPVQAFLGKISAAQAWHNMLAAACWVALLVLLAQFMQRAGVRRLSIAGG
jgi:ABC-2 type transport system permease protein